MENLRRFVRGKINCACGGGKTLIEYQALLEGYTKHNHMIQVIVAPTIALLKQHHDTFCKWDLFSDVVVIHFRTGEAALLDKDIEYVQTTNAKEFIDALEEYSNRKVLVFVTYASERKMFDACRKSNKMIDLCVWDEFHHLIPSNQSQEISSQKEHLQTLPVYVNLFFSASEKHGAIISSFDETLFGEKIGDVSYSFLRSRGIVVPKIVIKGVRIKRDDDFIALEKAFSAKAKQLKLKAIKKDDKINAAQSGVDLEDVVLETAALELAREDMLKTNKTCSILTFSKSVAACKLITTTCQDRFDNALLQTVHAAIPGNERQEIFDRIGGKKDDAGNSICAASNDSILCQYGIVKEGIDLTAFNALVLSRNLDVTGLQQAIGRPTRAHSEDTRRLQSGEISIDDLSEHIKPIATIYIPIGDDESMEDFMQYTKELCEKLQYGLGLKKEDWDFGGLIEKRRGVDIESDDAWAEKLKREVCLDGETLNDWKNKLYVSNEEEVHYNVDLELAREMNLIDLTNEYLNE